MCQLRLAWQLVRDRRRLRYANRLNLEAEMLAMMLLNSSTPSRPKRLVLTFHGSEILRFAGIRSPAGWGAGSSGARRAISTLSLHAGSALQAFPGGGARPSSRPAHSSYFPWCQPRPPAPGKKPHPHPFGRLAPAQGQLLTLQALQALAPEFRRQSIWLVGSRASRTMSARWRLRRRGRRISREVFRRLPDDELEEIYRGADIFAMTSINHGDSIEASPRLSRGAAHGLPSSPTRGRRQRGVWMTARPASCAPAPPAQLTAAV